MAMAEGGAVQSILQAEDSISIADKRESRVSELCLDLSSFNDNEGEKDGFRQNQEQSQQPPTGETPRQQLCDVDEGEASPAIHRDAGKHFATDDESDTKAEVDKGEIAVSENSGNDDGDGGAGSAPIETYSAIEAHEKLNKYLGKVQLEMTRLDRKLSKMQYSETIALRHQMANLSQAIRVVGAVKIDNTEDLRREHRIELAVEKEKVKHLGAEIHKDKTKLRAKEAAKEAEFKRKIYGLKGELQSTKTRIHHIRQAHDEEMAKVRSCLSNLANAHLQCS